MKLTWTLTPALLLLLVRPSDAKGERDTLVVVIVLVIVVVYTSVCPLTVQEENPEFWRSQARRTLQSALDRKLNTNVAKNILFFLGDGNAPIRINI